MSWTRGNRIRTGRLAILVVALVAAATPALAQPRIQVVGTPTCPGCTFERTKVITLGGTDAPALLAEVPRVARDSRGRFHVTGANYNVVVFDATGRYLSSMGRQGSGPGEFSTPPSTLFVGPGDSLYALNTRAVSVFSPAFVHARSSSLPGSSMGSAMLRNGEIAWQGSNAATRQRYTLNLLSRTGEQLHILRDTVSPSPPCLECTARTVSTAADGVSIWTGAPNQYEIEQVSRDGRVLRTVSVRDSKWFQPWTEPVPRDRTGSTRPRTRLAGVVDGSEGRLWVKGWAPASDWKPNPAFDIAARGVRRLSPEEMAYRSQSFATILDLIDLRSGRLIASQRYDREAFFFLGPDLIWTTRQDAEGNTFVDVWRLTVKNPAG